MNKNDNTIVDRAVKAFSESPVAQGPSEDLIRQTLEQIEKEQDTIPFMERILTMKSISKFAAAVFIIIGLSAVFLFNSGPGSIALADVYARVQQAQAYVYRMSMTITGMGELTGLSQMNGPMDMDVTVTISQDYGMKLENHMTASGPQGQTQNISQFAYLLPQEKTMVSIIPEQKMFQRIEFTDDLLEETKKQNNDPRELIKQMMNSEYVELEPTEIDGVRVQGFQTTDPSYAMGVVEEITATLWVDVDTWMPVKCELEGTISGMQVAYSIDGFQWNVPVTAADFEYTIPEDYQNIGNMKMPAMNEEAAVQGLQTYSKYFGAYPEKIDLASLIPAMMKDIKELRDNPQTDAAREFVRKMEDAGDDQAKIQEFTQEFTMPVQSLAMFHMKLMQDKKDPMYYGDQVTPGDTDAVLLRWKIECDTYKVIFGDLAVGEMQYQDLVEIEPQPQPEVAPEEVVTP